VEENKKGIIIPRKSTGFTTSRPTDIVTRGARCHYIEHNMLHCTRNLHWVTNV